MTSDPTIVSKVALIEGLFQSSSMISGFVPDVEFRAEFALQKAMASGLNSVETNLWPNADAIMPTIPMPLPISRKVLLGSEAVFARYSESTIEASHILAHRGKFSNTLFEFTNPSRDLGTKNLNGFPFILRSTTSVLYVERNTSRENSCVISRS